MNKKKVPKDINNPPTVLWFEIDEILIMLVSYVGMLFIGGKVWMWLGIGLVLTVLYMRLKRKKSKGFLKHLLYYALGLNLKLYPPGLIRKFRE